MRTTNLVVPRLVESERVKNHGSHLLRAARLKRGLNQVEAAKLLSIGQHDISSYEVGRHMPRTVIAVRIHKVFGVPIESWK